MVHQVRFQCEAEKMRLVKLGFQLHETPHRLLKAANPHLSDVKYRPMMKSLFLN